MNLDTAWDNFESAPCFNTALSLLTVAAACLREGRIGLETFNQFSAKTASFLNEVDDKSMKCAVECVEVLSEGWGEKEERRAAEEIAPIIRRYLREARRA